MGTRTFSQAEKFAIFTVHGEKCWLCQEPLTLSEVEIDHIIPESLEDSPRLSEILTSFGLPLTFNLNGWANLRPAHRICNGKKNARVFKPSMLFQMELEIGLEKASKVEKTIENYLTDRKLNQAVAILVAAADAGKLPSRHYAKIAELVTSRSEAYREPELRGTPFAVAPYLTVIGEDSSRYFLRGRSGLTGYRPKGDKLDPSWDCPNCGPTGWNGTRCISCGHLIDPD